MVSRVDTLIFFLCRYSFSFLLKITILFIIVYFDIFYFFWLAISRPVLALCRTILLDTQLYRHHSRFTLLYYQGHITGFTAVFIDNPTRSTKGTQFVHMLLRDVTTAPLASLVYSRIRMLYRPTHYCNLLSLMIDR